MSGHCSQKLQCPNRCECSEIVKREMGVPGLLPDLSRAVVADETREVAICGPDAVDVGTNATGVSNAAQIGESA